MPLIQTAVDPAEQTALILRGSATGTYNQMLGALQNSWQVVWHNPFGLTPQQVMDAMGTDAASLFAVASDMAAILAKYGADVSSIHPPDGVTVTIHPDGTVTLS